MEVRAGDVYLWCWQIDCRAEALEVPNMGISLHLMRSCFTLIAPHSTGLRRRDTKPWMLLIVMEAFRSLNPELR